MTNKEHAKSPSHLSGSHRHTYEAIFRHPVAHNLEWHDVLSLLGAIGTVAEEHNGVFKITRNGQVLALHAPKQKDAPVEMVLDIRHYLERSQDAAPPTETL